MFLTPVYGLPLLMVNMVLVIILRFSNKGGTCQLYLKHDEVRHW